MHCWTITCTWNHHGRRVGKVKWKSKGKEDQERSSLKPSTLAITAAIYWLHLSSHRNGRALSIQPKMPEIFVRNGTDQFGSVRLEYLGTPLKVVHFDRSGHFGRSDRIVSFHFDKIGFPSTAILYLPYKDNNQTRGGLARVSVAGMYRTVPLGTWNFLNFKPEFLLNGKHPLSPLKCLTFLFNPIVNDTLFFELLRAKTDACSWSFFPFRTLSDNPLTTLPYGLLDSLSSNAKV